MGSSKRKGLVHNMMLKFIISFHKGMKAAVVSGMKSSTSFDVTNDTREGCIMGPILFALFLAVMLRYPFGDTQSDVKFQFRTIGGIFIHQRSKAGTLRRTIFIHDLLFAGGDAPLGAVSLQEAQELPQLFSAACKDFGLNISIKKTELFYQHCPTAKQIRDVK